MTTALIYHPQADEVLAVLGDAAGGITFRLATTHAAALADGADADILFALDPDLTRELIAAAPRLRWVQALTSGTDALVAMPELPPDVIVTSMHGAHGPQVSELAILLMLALARRFPAMLANQRAHRWDHWRQPPLFGSTVTIVGLGSIGEELARRCKAFDMTVAGVDAVVRASPNVDRMYAAHDLHAALQSSDFVVVLVPYTPATHHLIDAAAFAAMPSRAYLINVARGAVVDESALIAALRDGVIAGAGLDVFSTEPLPPESPLWTMDNVIVTPHVGGNSTTYIRQMQATLVHNLRAFSDGRPHDLRNVVRRD